MFTAFLTRKPEMLWKHYLAALSLLLAIVLASHMFEFQALKSARKDAELINISGKQRMLSQQIVLFAKDKAGQGVDATTSRDPLNQSIVAFESAHALLLEEADGDPEISAIYHSGKTPAHPIILNYLDLAKAIAQADHPLQSDIEELYLLGIGPVLTQLDRAVSGFERVAKKRANSMHMLQESTLLVAVFVVLLEALFIFLPAQRIVRQTLGRLREEINEHQATNHRLSNFVNVASDLYWETDLDYRITYVEGRLLSRLRGNREDLVGCHYGDLAILAPDQATRLLQALQKFESYRDIRADFTDVDGVSYVLNLSGTPRYDRDGKLVGYLGTADDVTADVSLLGEVTRLSLTDPLTNIANKRAFERDLKTALETATERRPVCLLALDLDDFKPVNDTYGHGAGDQVIKVIAMRIQSELRADAWVARTGGDEFCVVCTNDDAVTIASSLAKRISLKVSEPIKMANGATVTVGVSIGIAEAPLLAATPEKLLTAADVALYEAKRAGRNLIRIAKAGQVGGERIGLANDFPSTADGSNLAFVSNARAS